MHSAKLQHYRELLSRRKSELTRQVDDRLHRHGLEHHADAALPRRSEDTDDDAVANSLRDADVANLSHAARELALIDAANQRLDDGSYGICVECDDPIPAQRLDAYPEAVRCAQCQTRFEHQHPDALHPPPD